jgi:REP element-mobilizing transposase RayT
MARRPRLFAPGLLYHVIVRGNQRRKTFYDDQDYRVYLDRLARYRQRYGYTVHAYCLMPNHVHLLVESGRSPLGKFMQGLQQSYSQYFNLRHRKVGHVFQGRYQAIVCQKDDYLLELLRYIHLNPVRSGLAKDLKDYAYSGHEAYLRGKGTEIIDPRKIFTMVGVQSGYRNFMRDGMKDGHKDEYYTPKTRDSSEPRGLGKSSRTSKLSQYPESGSELKQ